MYLVLKFGLSAALIVAISEIAKRSTLLGALLASLPLTSILAMIWLYVETADGDQVAALSGNIFWLVLPSLVLFLILPVLLRAGTGFYPALGISIGATALSYGLMLLALRHYGIAL